MPKRYTSVVLVGRPNVGKSTLFNRITGMRRAIVAPVAGTTRDVINRTTDWQGVEFEIVDTGGMFGASEDPLHELVLQRGRRALESADLLVFVTDGREGLTPGDRQIAEVIRAAAVPVILAINKTDDHRARVGGLEFFELGFDPIVEVSAEHGTGVGDLLDTIIQRVRRSGSPTAPDSTAGEESAELQLPRRDEVAVSIVGRPNAGKSSLVNRLLREERMIVSPTPGTTRDTVDTVMTWHRRRFRIVDTAGIRRPGRVAGGGAVENVSVMLAKRSMADADVVVLVVDATAGVTEQDAAIVGEAEKAGCGVILVANKWDLMKDHGPDTAKVFDEDLRHRLKFLDYAPILHLSALTGERTPKLLEGVDRVAAARLKRVKTPELNRFVARITAEHPPASPGRANVRVLYAAQIGVAPPTFVFFTNVGASFHFSYERFLVNQLRQEFGFEGTPLRIQVRAKRRSRRPDGSA
jgi:GTP-binding protein